VRANKALVIRARPVRCAVWKPISRNSSQIFRLPAGQRRRLRTTNVIERLFVEVPRRIRTMCAFTPRDSCERILFSVFYRMNPLLGQMPSKAFYTKFVTSPSRVRTFRLDRNKRFRIAAREC
jgi:transposase-like protein